MIEKDRLRFMKNIDLYQQRQRRQDRIDKSIIAVQWAIALLTILWIGWMVYQISHVS